LDKVYKYLNISLNKSGYDKMLTFLVPRLE